MCQFGLSLYRNDSNVPEMNECMNVGPRDLIGVFDTGNIGLTIGTPRKPQMLDRLDELWSLGFRKPVLKHMVSRQSALMNGSP